jgi:hypothetical protein
MADAVDPFGLVDQTELFIALVGTDVARLAAQEFIARRAWAPAPRQPAAARREICHRLPARLTARRRFAMP